MCQHMHESLTRHTLENLQKKACRHCIQAIGMHVLCAPSGLGSSDSIFANVVTYWPACVCVRVLFGQHHKPKLYYYNTSYPPSAWNSVLLLFSPLLCKKTTSQIVQEKFHNSRSFNKVIHTGILQ